MLALGTAAMYLPHQHPKFLDLIKQPFVKVMQMIAGIIDGTSSKEGGEWCHFEMNWLGRTQYSTKQ